MKKLPATRQFIFLLAVILMHIRISSAKTKTLKTMKAFLKLRGKKLST